MNAVSLIFLALMAGGIAQFVAGHVGMEHDIGVFWEVVALVSAYLFRITLR
jgi:hypothetical protein